MGGVKSERENGKQKKREKVLFLEMDEQLEHVFFWSEKDSLDRHKNVRIFYVENADDLFVLAWK